jgi:hypothetical protein
MAYSMPKIASLFALVIVLLLVLYTVSYFVKPDDYKNNEKKEECDENSDSLPEKPYSKTPIYSVDDYEYSLIFQSEGSREASKKEINDAMSRYPVSWTVQPPSSQYFQENRENFENMEKNTTPPDTKIYDSINGNNMIPPDTKSIEEEEKKILQTYKPESSKGLLSYSLEDVKSLIDKVYLKKGLLPVIEKSNQGENVYEVVEVKEKDPHIVWEDDIQKMTERDKMDARMEEIISVPQTVNDLAAGLDPFFEPRTTTRDSKFDYTQWTPGLERMFAPTYPIKEWF